MKNEYQKISIEDLIKILPEHVYWLDINMLFLGCNENQAKFIGLSSPNEIIGKSIYDFQPKEIAKKIIQNNLEVINKKKTMEFNESSISHGDTIKTFLSKKTPILDNNGNVTGVLGISIDISNQNEKINDNENLIRNIISHLPGHVYWQDTEGVILGANDQQARSLGFEKSVDLIGKNAYHLISKSQAEKLKLTNDTVIETKKTIIKEEIATFKTGTVTTLSYKVPLYNLNNSIKGILGISLDITKIKLLEQDLKNQINLTQIEKKKSTLFFSIAKHEITNKISTVILLLNGLQKSDISDKNDNFNTVKENCISESENAIDSINYLSKFNFLNNFTVNKNKNLRNFENFLFELKNIINDINNKNINIKINIDDNLPLYLEFQDEYVNEIIKILLQNSIKYTENNSNIYVEVKIKENQLFFTIIDKGIGIDKKHFKNLFLDENLIDIQNENTQFFNVSIKLSYIKKLLKLLEGNFKIISKRKFGTKIFFSVPFQYNKSNMTKINETKKNINNLNILMVEDSLITLNAQKEIFQKYINKNNIDIALNGMDAIKLASKNKYDYIFTDISLPDINGIELIKIIKKISLNPEVSFIAITSHTSNDDYKILLKEDFLTVIHKPINEKNIENLLNNI